MLGTGKSFQLLKFACSNHCLIFFGQLPTTLIQGTDISENAIDQYEGGLKDATIETVAKMVVEDCNFVECGLFNNLNASHYMNINILTRLLVLLILKEYHHRIVTPKEFLLAQLSGNIGRIKSAMDALCRNLPSPQSVIELICQAKEQLSASGVTVAGILDEAYVLGEFTYAQM